MNLAIHSKAGTAVVRKALLGATMLTLLTATAARADVPKFGFSTENSDAFRAVQQQLPVSLWSPFVGWKGANELNVVLNQARAYHVQPMITWESWDARRRSPGKPAKPARGWSDAAIANGSQDAYVRRQARYVKQYRQVVYIRFDHEMNGNRWYPWNGPSAAYRRMWIHVWGIFHRLHVTNVRWVWSPNPNSYESDDVFDRRVASFYPGSRYVDIVGMTVTRVLTQGGTLIHLVPPAVRPAPELPQTALDNGGARGQTGDAGVDARLPSRARRSPLDQGGELA